MKTTPILAALMFAAAATSAQNTFPTSGPVGIGATSPDHSLTVRGTHHNSSIHVNYDHWGDALYSASLLLWASEPGISYTGAGIGNNIYNGPTGITRKSTARGGSYIRLLDGQVKIHTVDVNGTHSNPLHMSTDGKVGIGTEYPFEKLSVIGNIMTCSPYPGSGLTPQAAWVGSYATNANSSQVGFAGMKVEYGRLGDLDFSSTLKFLTCRDNEPVERMTIDAQGNVGIGKAAPANYKLAVEGTIGARRVKITQETWADHVFDKSHQRPSLAALDQYITAHRHLPGIPTAAEVKENGVDVGDMQAKLLEKVEELTLYLIEERKRNDALEKRIRQLEKRK
ncbi:hypothetical protein [Chitinophaga lutea]|nr:hypothetical protein [Chitinophaga lutea]